MVKMLPYKASLPTSSNCLASSLPFYGYHLCYLAVLVLASHPYWPDGLNNLLQGRHYKMLVYWQTSCPTLLRPLWKRSYKSWLLLISRNDSREPSNCFSARLGTSRTTLALQHL